MSTTTYPEFNSQTEALEVARAFGHGIRGKTILVTGANADGIGYTTLQAFASQSPAHLILAGRSPEKLAKCTELLKAQFPDVDYRSLLVDLSSQKSVKQAAAAVLSWDDVPVVDIVVNSAGVMAIPERTLSEDGIEMHFATNHLGHWLLTCSLMPKLIAAARASPKGATRIVNVTSASPQVARIRWSDINFERLNKDLPEDEQPNYAFLEAWGYKDVLNKPYVGLEGYNQSKVANVLFSVGATARLYEKYGILSLAVHPGVIPTELGRNFEPEILSGLEELRKRGVYTYKTQGAGASTSLVAALDPKLGPGVTADGKENYGVYMDDCQISDKALPTSVSSVNAEKLWKLSEELTNAQFSW